MSVADDVRQVFQDFLAPELRAISARIEAQNARFDALDARISRLEVTISNQISDLKAAFEFDKRLSRLEAEKKSA